MVEVLEKKNLIVKKRSMDYPGEGEGKYAFACKERISTCKCCK